MQTKKTKYLYLILTILFLMIPALGCGASTPIRPPAESVEDVPVVEEQPTATEAPASAPAGTTPENPATRTETVSTANWEVSVVEAHRGEQAAAMLEEASAFNDAHPDPTMEYVVVKVHAKYAGTDSDTHRIDGTFFQSMDSMGVLYDRVKITDVDAPNPSMSSFDDLTAGGEVEGWVVIQVKKDDPGILLVILPRDNGLALGPETTRYVSLAE